MSQTVLVADDSKTIRQIVGMALKASPYRLVEASSARATLDALQQRPDVILLDYHMPDGSGYDVCRAIKGNAATRNIPIVMLGGTFKNFDEARARQSGADQIVWKPFQTDQLIEAIEQAISGASVSAPSGGFPSPTPAASTPAAPSLAAPPNPFGAPAASSLPRPNQNQAPLPTPTPTPNAAVANRSGLPGANRPDPGLSAAPAAAPAMSKEEMQALISDEVKRIVREQLPEMLRAVLGNLVEQKLMPKMMQRTEERVNQVISTQLNQRVTDQVRSELERLLSD